MSIEETALPSNELCGHGPEEILPEVPEAFSVRDDASANWLVRRIVECRAYADRCAEWAARERRRAEREEEFFWARYGAQLRDYVRTKITEQGGRRKSVTLPAGMAGFRTVGSSVVVDDETAAIAWARAHVPDLVTTIEKLSKSGLNTHIETTGEVPESGVHIEPAHERFYVK